MRLHTALSGLNMLNPSIESTVCLFLSSVSERAADSHRSLAFAQDRKKQPKHKDFGQDIPGTSGTQTSGYPGKKLHASGLFLLF